MYTFLLLAVPCLLLFFLNSPLAGSRADGQSTRRSSYWLAFCTGFFPALAYCFIDEFFIFNAYRFSNELAPNYVYLLLKDSLVPTVILCSIYFLFSRREPEDRSFALLVVLAACYMAYLPYEVATGEERFSPFRSLVKPILTCSHIVLLPLCCRGLCRSLKGGSPLLSAAFVLGMLASPALPPLAETLWYMKGAAAGWMGITAAMFAAAVILPIFLCKTGGKTLDKSI